MTFIDISATDLIVPLDFPRLAPAGALPGAQPKLLVVLQYGKFYLSGSTPSEVHERWLRCCDLRQQLACRALESKAGKRSHMSEQAILDQYLDRLIRTRWTTEQEAYWVISKVAEELNWPLPATLQTYKLQSLV